MVKRTSKAIRRKDIPQAAIEAWKRGDEDALAAALGLGTWEYSPLPDEFAGAYAVPHTQPTPDGTAMKESWFKITALKNTLYDLAGAPGEG
jgi:hypothetical protein